jgi:DNA primase large subunit
MPPCIKAIQDAVLPDGVRHRAYLSLARFYRWIGMHPDEIREWIKVIDSRNPIRDPDYINRTIEWACAHPGLPGCNDESLRRYCRSENCFYVRIKKNAGGK